MTSGTPPPTETTETKSPDTEVSSSSDTLASYITNYRIENGRRYHAYQDGWYWGPNDEPASEGQDLAHAMYNLTLGALHHAPLSQPREILDVGTGTGIWAIDMADTYPDAQVTGTDLSPIQPEMVPPNCLFEIDDATLEWTWDDDHFDFVHVREMFGSISDWDSFAREAFRCTRPGGYVEIVEHSTWPVSDDGSMGPEHFYNLWGRTVEEIGVQWGKTFGIWKESKSVLERAGFVDVVEGKFQWPMNAWPDDPKLKHIGSMNQMRLSENLEGFMLRLLTVTGKWPIERVHVFIAEMRMAMKDLECHAYLPLTVVYGRKPS